jgi:hypothetical protein
VLNLRGKNPQDFRDLGVIHDGPVDPFGVIIILGLNFVVVQVTVGVHIDEDDILLALEEPFVSGFIQCG